MCASISSRPRLVLLYSRYFFGTIEDTDRNNESLLVVVFVAIVNLRGG